VHNPLGSLQLPRQFDCLPALQLGKPKMTLYRWIHAGKIISIEFGAILFIPKKEVERITKAKVVEKP